MENVDKVIVIDSSCTPESPVREHTMRMPDGTFEKVVFRYGIQTILDYALGVKFNQEGFIVLDAETQLRLRTPPKTDGTVRMKIAPDEVVAKYDELSDAALRMRAATTPGGEEFIIGDHLDRDAVIAFLINPRGSNPKQEPAQDPEQEDDEPSFNPLSISSDQNKPVGLPDIDVMKPLSGEDITEV